MEKTPAHSFHFEEIVHYYHDAKIIAIKRSPIDQVKSGIMLQKRRVGEQNFIFKKFNMIVRLFKYHSCYKHIGHFMSKNPGNMKLITYEELQKSTRSIIAGLCDFLEIEFEEEMLRDRDNRKSNTSFVSDSDRDKVLSTMEAKGLLLISYLLGLFPYRLYRLVYLSWHAITVRRRKLPYWFFKTKIKQYGWSTPFLD